MCRYKRALKSRIRSPYRFDHKNADGGQFWRCLKDGCSGRIKTDDNSVFLELRNANHSHSMEPENVTVRETATRMNERNVGAYESQPQVRQLMALAFLPLPSTA